MEQARLKYIHLHGTAARVLTSGHPPDTVNRVLTYDHLPGPLKRKFSAHSLSIIAAATADFAKGIKNNPYAPSYCP